MSDFRTLTNIASFLSLISSNEVSNFCNPIILHNFFLLSCIYWAVQGSYCFSCMKVAIINSFIFKFKLTLNFKFLNSSPYLFNYLRLLLILTFPITLPKVFKNLFVFYFINILLWNFKYQNLRTLLLYLFDHLANTFYSDFLKFPIVILNLLKLSFLKAF